MAIDAAARAALKREARSRSTGPARLLEIALADPELAKWVAGSTRATAAVLGPLAAHPLPAVRSRVAKHPATPGTALEALSRDAGASLLKTIARNPATPARTLERLARDGGDAVLEALAQRSSLPARALDRLVADGRARLRILVQRHAQAIGARPGTLETLMTHERTIVRAEVAERVPLDAARAERLFADPEPWVVASLGRNDLLADRERWRERVLSHPDAEVRARAARGHLDPEHFARFLADPEPRVRAALVDQLRLDPADLAALSRDPVERVRCAVAGRFFGFDASIARALAEDPSATVRAALAGNRNAPPDVLEALAGDAEDLVRLVIASNRGTGGEALARLSRDPSTTAFEVARFGEPPVRIRVAELAAEALAGNGGRELDFQPLFESRLD